MKHGTREESLQAFGRAYIDAKNNKARVLMIVLREADKDGYHQGEIVSFGLDDMEAARLCADTLEVLTGDSDD